MALALDAARAADQTGVSTRLLAVLAVLSANGVRRELPYAAGQAGVLVPGGHPVAAGVVDGALAELTRRSLLTPDSDDRTVVMDRLAAEVTRAWLSGRGQLAAAGRAAVTALEAWARSLDVTRDRLAARDLPEQVTALLGQVAVPAGRAGEELASGLLRLRFLALYYLIELGDSAPQAVTAAASLMADLERMLGRDHPDTLNARNSLAVAYLAAGRPAEAIPLSERTLVSRERTLGPDHPDTLTSQNNLAVAYLDAGRVDEAILLFRLTLAARERRLGAGHQDTLSSRGNLAAAYRAAGWTAEAIPLLEQTLTGRERVLGLDHPDTQAARNNLDQARRDLDRPPAVLSLPADPEPAPEPEPEPEPAFAILDEEEPDAGEIAAEEPAITAEEPPAEEPAQEAEPGEPGDEEPVAEESASGEPAVDDHAAVWAAVAELVATEPAAEEAPGQGPAAEEAAVQGPAAEEAAVPEPEIPRPRPPDGAARPAPGPPGRRAVRLPWVAAAVLLLIAASGAAGALSRLHAGGHAPAGARASPAPPADAAQLAADWVAQQVSHDVTVACDPLMCAALEARGMPTARLLVLRATTPSPRGAGVVVSTPAVRSQFGSRLDSEYAPSVIAGFGSGPDQVQVQVVAPDGATAYRAALRQDLATRKAAGAELLSNQQIGITGQARAQLAAGAVDARLLILLPTLAATHPVQVLAFGNSGPGAGPGTPLCVAELSGSGRAAGLPDAAYQRWLTSFVRAQLDRFTGSVTVVRARGQTVVRVDFARPSPLGLLAA